MLHNTLLSSPVIASILCAGSQLNKRSWQLLNANQPSGSSLGMPIFGGLRIETGAAYQQRQRFDVRHGISRLNGETYADGGSPG